MLAFQALSAGPRPKLLRQTAVGASFGRRRRGLGVARVTPPSSHTSVRRGARAGRSLRTETAGAASLSVDSCRLRLSPLYASTHSGLAPTLASQQRTARHAAGGEAPRAPRAASDADAFGPPAARRNHAADAEPAARDTLAKRLHPDARAAEAVGKAAPAAYERLSLSTAANRTAPHSSELIIHAPTRTPHDTTPRLATRWRLTNGGGGQSAGKEEHNGKIAVCIAVAGWLKMRVVEPERGEALSWRRSGLRQIFDDGTEAQREPSLAELKRRVDGAGGWGGAAVAR